MRVPTQLALLSALLLGVAAPLSAQAIAQNDSTPVRVTVTTTDSAVTTTPAAGASMTGLRSAVHSRETARPLSPVAAPADRAGLGQARAMMIVGGAALVAGAIIGGDAGTIIMVGGAVIGLIGLYDWLQ